MRCPRIGKYPLNKHRRTRAESSGRVLPASWAEHGSQSGAQGISV